MIFSTFIVLTGLVIATVLFGPIGWIGLGLIVWELLNFFLTLDAMRTINDAVNFNKLMFISILVVILGPVLLPLFAAAGPLGFVLFAYLYAFVWTFEHLWF